MTKKRKITVSILVGVLFTAALMSAAVAIQRRRSHRIAAGIINECKANDETVIGMSDFTDFEWDRCIVYGAAAQTKDIREELGIDYDTYLDLNYGIVFVKDNSVVYEEFFDVSQYDFTNETPPFIIYPYAEESSERVKYRCFTKNDAEFKCIKKEYDNKSFYRLYPMSDNVNGK